MGEHAEMILEGIFCEVCGFFIDDHNEGIPRKCDDCKE
jgi:predicted Zn-ribbon and HTH transcriptional regulator